MSKTDIWMPFYIADYLADTTRLTTEQHGAYILLILDYWRNGPPPNDPATLAQIARMPIDAWGNASSKILAFFENGDGVLIHKRIDQEKAEANSNNDKKIAKAKAAADARWGKNAPRSATSMPQEKLELCPSPSPSPLSSSKEDKKPLGENLSSNIHPGKSQESFELTTDEQKDAKPILTKDFAIAWDAYPARHGGNSKTEAFKQWNARLREGVPVQAMLDGVERYAAHCRASGKVGTEFVMQAVRFFGKSKQYAESWEIRAQQPSTSQAVSKFHVNQHDHSSTHAAMQATVKKYNLEIPENDDEISFGPN